MNVVDGFLDDLKPALTSQPGGQRLCNHPCGGRSPHGPGCLYVFVNVFRIFVTLNVPSRCAEILK